MDWTSEGSQRSNATNNSVTWAPDRKKREAKTYLAKVHDGWLKHSRIERMGGSTEFGLK